MPDESGRIQVDVREGKRASDGVHYYDVVVSYPNGKEWVVKRRYSQFDDLCEELAGTVEPMPTMPGKSVIIRRRLSRKFKARRYHGLCRVLDAALNADPAVLRYDALRYFLDVRRHSLARFPLLPSILEFCMGTQEMLREMSASTPFQDMLCFGECSHERARAACFCRERIFEPRRRIAAQIWAISRVCRTFRDCADPFRVALLPLFRGCAAEEWRQQE